MAKPKKGDPERANKWAERAVAWQMLAATTHNEHVSEVCTSFARTSMDMAEYWSGQ